ncbi:hypothetical protein MIR68_002715 [Amoeboaphelidium protococcarum]|nr:hypothetical protein MIR68_002715 [Amoeboaphelidium protococcarum]
MSIRDQFIKREQQQNAQANDNLPSQYNGSGDDKSRIISGHGEFLSAFKDLQRTVMNEFSAITQPLDDIISIVGDTVAFGSQSSSSSFRSGYSSTYKQNPDGSSEKIVHKRNPDGSMIVERTLCDASKQCETFSEFIEASKQQ